MPLSQIRSVPRQEYFPQNRKEQCLRLIESDSDTGNLTLGQRYQIANDNPKGTTGDEHTRCCHTGVPLGLPK